MDETFDELCCVLSDTSYPDEVVRRFSAAHRRLEWLSVRAALKQMLHNPPVIAYYPSGKPYLKDSPLHISISHTKGYVAVIIGQAGVGIDIENVFIRSLQSLCVTMKLLLHLKATIHGVCCYTGLLKKSCLSV